MTDLQRKILEALEWFHEFCVQNNLRYYIIGGTMLGAVRHNGFIPWDDDADVGMPRDDYNRLIRLMKHSQSKYILESPWSDATDYLYTYGKLYDTTTTLIENTGTKLVRGVFLDIFPLDGVGNNKKEVDRVFNNSRFWVSFHTARICTLDHKRPGINNLIIRCIKRIPFIDNKKESKKVDCICSRINWKDAAYVGNITSTMQRNYVTPKAFYGKPTLYQFESIKVFGLEKYDDYLTSLYGDWHRLPPENKRVSWHDYSFLNLSLPYKNYTGGLTVNEN